MAWFMSFASRRRASGAGFAGNRQDQTAGQRLRFHQSHIEGLSELEDKSVFGSGQGMQLVIMNVVIIWQGADGDQTISTGLEQRDEQAGPGHAVHARAKGRTNAVSQKIRREPVNGAALCRRRA